MGARYKKNARKINITAANLRFAIKIGVNMKLFFMLVREVNLKIFYLNGVFRLPNNVSYKRSSAIDKTSFYYVTDLKFIKLLWGFALARYCVYALLATVFTQYHTLILLH